MQRYEKYAEMIKGRDGRRRYGTLFYPEISRKDTDIYFIAKSTDRMDLLAHRYYNDRRLWVIIAKANKLHNATMRIPSGMRIRIPYPLNRLELNEAFINKNL